MGIDPLERLSAGWPGVWPFDGLADAQARRHRRRPTHPPPASCQPPDGADLPIVALTAHAAAERRLPCLAAGINDVLSPPVEPDLRLARVLQWLAASAEPVTR